MSFHKLVSIYRDTEWGHKFVDLLDEFINPIQKSAFEWVLDRLAILQKIDQVLQLVKSDPIDYFDPELGLRLTIKKRPHFLFSADFESTEKAPRLGISDLKDLLKGPVLEKLVPPFLEDSDVLLVNVQVSLVGSNSLMLKLTLEMPKAVDWTALSVQKAKVPITILVSPDGMPRLSSDLVFDTQLYLLGLNLDASLHQLKTGWRFDTQFDLGELGGELGKICNTLSLKSGKPLGFSLGSLDGEWALSAKGLLPKRIDFGFVSFDNTQLTIWPETPRLNLSARIPLDFGGNDISFVGDVTFGGPTGVSGQFGFDCPRGLRILAGFYVTRFSVGLSPDATLFETYIYMRSKKSSDLPSLSEMGYVKAKLRATIPTSDFSAEFPELFQLNIGDLVHTLTEGGVSLPRWMFPITLSGHEGAFATPPQDEYKKLEVNFKPSEFCFGMACKLDLFDGLLKTAVKLDVNSRRGISFSGVMWPIHIGPRGRYLQITGFHSIEKGPHVEGYFPLTGDWSAFRFEADAAVKIFDLVDARARLFASQRGIEFDAALMLDLAILKAKNQWHFRLNEHEIAAATHMSLYLDFESCNLGPLNGLKVILPSVMVSVDVKAHMNSRTETGVFAVRASFEVAGRGIDFSFEMGLDTNLNHLCDVILEKAVERIRRQSGAILDGIRELGEAVWELVTSVGKYIDDVISHGLGSIQDAFQQVLGVSDRMDERFHELEAQIHENRRLINQNRELILKTREEMKALQREVAENRRAIALLDARLSEQQNQIDRNATRIEAVLSELTEVIDLRDSRVQARFKAVEIAFRGETGALHERIDSLTDMLRARSTELNTLILSQISEVHQRISDLERRLETDIDLLRKKFQLQMELVQKQLGDVALESKWDSLVGPLNRLEHHMAWLMKWGAPEDGSERSRMLMDISSDLKTLADIVTGRTLEGGSSFFKRLIEARFALVLSGELSFSQLRKEYRTLSLGISGTHYMGLCMMACLRDSDGRTLHCLMDARGRLDDLEMVVGGAASGDIETQRLRERMSDFSEISRSIRQYRFMQVPHPALLDFSDGELVMRYVAEDGTAESYKGAIKTC